MLLGAPSVVWCEYATSAHAHGPLAEFFNATSNAFFLLAGALGLRLSRKKLKPAHPLLPSFLLADRTVVAVGCFSFLFHAFPSRLTQVGDELSMCFLALGYLLCAKGSCALSRPPNWAIILRSFQRVFALAFLVYAFVPVYAIFTTLFTVLVAVPALLNVRAWTEDGSLPIGTLLLSALAIGAGKHLWNAERAAYGGRACPASEGELAFYYHPLWHLFAAASHYCTMCYLRACAARKTAGGGAFAVLPQVSDDNL